MGETGLNHRQIHHILPSSGGWETKSADYLNYVNPAGTVPVLVHNGHPIYESHEQIVYIDQVLMPGGHSISKGSSRIYSMKLNNPKTVTFSFVSCFFLTQKCAPPY